MGFEGQGVDEPWATISVIVGTSLRGHLDSLVGALRSRGIQSAEIVQRHDLDDSACRTAMEWREPATLERVLFHLVLEYARHLGHLDIYAELVEGQIGE